MADKMADKSGEKENRNESFLSSIFNLHYSLFNSLLRGAGQWLPGYLRSIARRPRHNAGTRDLLFVLADHYEPFRGGIPPSEARDLVRQWVADYPAAFETFRDSDGKPPRHTFFFPAEEYDSECVRLLAELCAAGWGEIEIQLHHRHDTPSGLRDKLVAFRDRLRGTHGCLGTTSEGQAAYGFVHGNWALCNSRPDGDWCGVNEELTVLQQTGCYADFTFPSAPSPTQPRLVNAIYRAVDNPGRPRSHDHGVRVQAASFPVSPLFTSHYSLFTSADLMLITGPLALDWRRRKWGLFPRLENSALTAAHPPNAHRVRLWVRQGIHVAGRPEWIFVKAHTHGAVGEDARSLFGEGGRALHKGLAAHFNDGRNWRLHYVTAREAYNIARAAEDGMTGNAGCFRDYEITPPPM